MYFPFVIFVFFVVRPISNVSNWSFPDNRIKIFFAAYFFISVIT